MNKTMKKLLVAAGFLAMAGGAAAGTTDIEFQGIYDKIVEWTQGYLGRVICLGMLGTSMFLAFVKVNFLGSLGALGAALVLFNADGIISGIVSATV